jgi:hypothetical protein
VRLAGHARLNGSKPVEAQTCAFYETTRTCPLLHVSTAKEVIWVHLLFAVVVAVVFTGILWAIGSGNAYERSEWGAMLVLFGILFLTSWAGGVWLSPIGPQLFGAEWMPFVLMGFVVHYAYVDPRNAGHVAERPASEVVR